MDLLDRIITSYMDNMPDRISTISNMGNKYTRYSLSSKPDGSWSIIYHQSEEIFRYVG